MNLLYELEEFQCGHKARDIFIEWEEAYGSSPIVVSMKTEKGIVKCISYPCPPWDESKPTGELMGIKYLLTTTAHQEKLYKIYAYDQDKDDWAGLFMTIEKCLGFAKMLVNNV